MHAACSDPLSLALQSYPECAEEAGRLSSSTRVTCFITLSASAERPQATEGFNVTVVLTTPNQGRLC